MFLFALICLVCSHFHLLASAATSTWVFYDANMTLKYKADANGNRIIDYSYAGYGGGGVAIPDVPSQVSVTPSGGDDTAAIQKALSTVGSMSPDASGFRGAVELHPGSFTVSAPLKINASGVVLRGSGVGDGGTVLVMKGAPFRLFAVGGSGSPSLSNTVAMTDGYVPAGSTSFNVASTAGFQVGDTIYVHRPVTNDWIQFLGMDKLVRNGQPQKWMSAGAEMLTDRVITAMSDKQITIDVPLTDSWDAQFINPLGGRVSKYSFPSRISNVGVEHLAIVAPTQVPSGTPYSSFGVDTVIDAWIRDVRIQDTQNSVDISRNAKRITLDGVQVAHTYRRNESDAPADFALTGTQVLVNNCSVTGKGNTWPFVSQAQGTGPIVLLKCFADDRGFDPHERWTTGLLCDSTTFPNTYNADKTGIAYTDRGIFGSGQGWTTGWSVAWNVKTATLCVQQPPGSQNWAIGCTGKMLTQPAPGSNGTPVPNGIYESLGTPVTPGSLYLAQLKQRLGTCALNAIGYADVDGSPFTAGLSTKVNAATSPALGKFNNSVVVAITWVVAAFILLVI